MGIGDFDFVGMTFLPDRTDPVLLIDQDAVLIRSIPFQALRAIARRHRNFHKDRENGCRRSGLHLGNSRLQYSENECPRQQDILNHSSIDRGLRGCGGFALSLSKVLP